MHRSLERRAKGSLYWFEQTLLPKRGDMGLYDYHHRRIARALRKCEQFPNYEGGRHQFVAEIEDALLGIRTILSVWGINPKEDIKKTLGDVNRYYSDRPIRSPR